MSLELTSKKVIFCKVDNTKIVKSIGQYGDYFLQQKGKRQRTQVTQVHKSTVDNFHSNTFVAVTEKGPTYVYFY